MPIIQSCDYASSINQHRICRAASTENIVNIVSGAPNSLDSINLVVGDRIILKDQDTPSENGIYVVSALGSGSNGSWQRLNEFKENLSIRLAGLSFYIKEGTINEKKTFTNTSTEQITIGTHNIIFEELGGGAGAPGTDNNAIHTNESSEISALTEKASVVSGDYLLIEDSETANSKKRTSISGLRITQSQVTDLDTEAIATLVHGVTTLNIPILEVNGDAISSHNNELGGRRYDDAAVKYSRHIADNIPGYTGGDVIMRMHVSFASSGGVGEKLHFDIAYGWLEENGAQFSTTAYDYDVDFEPDVEGLLWDRIHILELTIPSARVSNTAKFIGIRIARDATHINDTLVSNIYLHKLELAYNAWGIDMRPAAPA